MDFEKWLYDVCVIMKPHNKDMEYVYSLIELSNAKLAYLDGETPVQYAKSIIS